MDIDKCTLIGYNALYPPKADRLFLDKLLVQVTPAALGATALVGTRVARPWSRTMPLLT
jgi:hypothetical protein